MLEMGAVRVEPVLDVLLVERTGSGVVDCGGEAMAGQ